MVNPKCNRCISTASSIARLTHSDRPAAPDSGSVKGTLAYNREPRRAGFARRQNTLFGPPTKATELGMSIVATGDSWPDGARFINHPLWGWTFRGQKRE